ncbi:MAG: 16S rRNA (uracil(1498)-N(3))-methyltransferase [Syntrophaceae bacterium]|nr:16S rRNA (uracil(1498)-N(3))-methyltransferase [Syntrophaceae bacterium]
MDRIVLNRKINRGDELQMKGPLLEALCFQGGRVGHLVTVTDSGGNDFRGRILWLSQTEASIYIFDTFSSPTESSLEIILLQALPEKERMELIIQKATELGVSTILPFKSERSISLEEREAKQRKAHRWQEIAVKAVQQSRRAKVPRVGPYCSFQEALKICEGENLKILLWEKEGENLKDALRRSPPQKVYVMVGPEGGFTEEEVKLAKDEGFIPVKLGQRILRTETAAITLVGILQYQLGDLG